MMRPAAPSGGRKTTLDETGAFPQKGAVSDGGAGPVPGGRYAEVDRMLGGKTVETAAGPTLRLERAYALPFRWGTVPLETWRRIPPKAWNRWLGRVTDGWFAPEAAAFVDLETTGLERGAGTYAFLVGIGRFEGDAFRVRQFFMRDYDEEPALLEAVLQELEDVRCVVTFNGRSFDWPLLQTRATMNRLELPDLPQLDILHPARRLWRAVTDDCRLIRLEEDILGVRREGDVPGYLIPELYFQYVRTGDAAPLAEVMEHNRRDLLTTAALAAYLGSAMEEPLQAAPAGDALPGTDLFAIGRVLMDRREWGAATASLHEALRRGLPRAMRSRCRRLLAVAYRRMGRYRDAADQWLALVDEGGLGVEPYVELAKYYEHKVKDVGRARRWTLRAMDIVHRRRMLGSRREGGGIGPGSPGAGTTMEELTHRLRRLDAKLLQQQALREREKQQLSLEVQSR